MNDKKDFSGLWGIILGGSSGFGLASVEKLSRHGMNVAVIYRETAGAERKLKEKLSVMAAAAGVSVLPFNINALDAARRVEFLEKFLAVAGKKCVRLLLHSIARGNLKPLVAQQNEVAINKDGHEVMSAEDIEMTGYAMSGSLLDWTRSVLQQGLFHPDARIVGLTSEGAHKYWTNYGAVSIAKASLESLSTYMAVEFSKYGLKTNLIQAGITETPSMKRIPESEKLIEVSKARNPAGRMTTPEDIANVVYLLCSAEAFWINGAVIHVDGGEHCC